MIKIEVVSDTICPWCYIGKRNFDLALKELPEMNISFKYTTFQLDPNTPSEGVNRKNYVEKKFNKDRYTEIKKNISNEALKSGIPNITNTLDIIPNTFDSHRLIYWAIEYGCQLEAVEMIFKAYFEESKDIGNITVLLKIAERLGMDSEVIMDRFKNDEDRKVVEGEERKARENGVMGVPSYIINDGMTLTGSQPVNSIVKLLQHLNKN
jgi:predicted DsbA family dithiol-disulfide isomerase